jgi:ankyrin repeat protein
MFQRKGEAMGASELFAAIKAGDLARVEALLAADPALASARDEGGMSALLTAAYWQQPAIVGALLARGPRLSFYEAAAAGVTGRLETALADNPALLDSYAADGFTALGLASFFGHGEAAALLLARGADANRASNNPMRVAPLHSAVAGRHLGIAQALLDAGADANAAQEGGFTPLHGAAQNGDRPMAELLLARGARADAATADGKTARDFALEEGHASLAELL